MAAPAFAQSSLDSSSAPATDYALPPPEGGSLAIPATPDDATAGDATPGDATSSAAMPTEPSAAGRPVTAADNSSDASAAAHSGWDRVGDVYTDTDSEDQVDRVFEVPQVLPPANPQPSSDDADQTAQEDGSQTSVQDPTPDQVGSIEDYQDEEDSALIGSYGVPVLIAPVGISPFGVSAFHAPLYRRGGFGQGFQRGFVPIVPRPFGGGMNSDILPTSPMVPNGSARSSGGMPMPFSRGMGFSGGMRGGRR
jgi:hypothetical protein